MIKLLSHLFFMTFCALSIFLSPKVFAHGEDRLGPNGGYVRMPGGFHAELVKAGKDKFKVYLLDINWKNPVTKNSSVAATLKGGQGEAFISCAPKKEYFECKLPDKFVFKSLKEISLQTKREQMVGGPAVYSVPLKLSK